MKTANFQMMKVTPNHLNETLSDSSEYIDEEDFDSGYDFSDDDANADNYEDDTASDDSSYEE